MNDSTHTQPSGSLNILPEIVNHNGLAHLDSEALARNAVQTFRWLARTFNAGDCLNIEQSVKVEARIAVAAQRIRHETHPKPKRTNPIHRSKHDLIGPQPALHAGDETVGRDRHIVGG